MTTGSPSSLDRRREAMAALLAARGIAVPDAPASPSEPAPVDGSPVASPTEERMWMLHELDPDAATGAAVGALWLTGDLDDTRLAAAFSAVTTEFPSLRTVYRPAATDAATVVPVELPPGPADVETYVVPDAPAAVRAAGDPGLRRFDLARDLPLRVRIVRVAAGADGGDLAEAAELRLLVVVGHHIALDDTAWPLILDRVSAHYGGAGVAGGDPTTEPTINHAYRRWARKRVEREGSAAEATDLAHWRGMFPETPRPLPLPRRWTTPPGGTREVVEVDGLPASPRTAGGPGRLRVDRPAGGAAVIATARGLGATPFHLEVALLSALLTTATGRRRIELVSPVVDLEGGDGEPLVGATGNLVPLVVDVDEKAPLAAHVSAVKTICLQAMAHSGVPIERVLGAVGAAGTRPFRVTVLLYASPAGKVRIYGVTATPASLPATAAETDLTLAMERPEEAVAVELTHAATIRDSAAREILEGFCALLDAAPDAGADEPLGDFVDRVVPGFRPGPGGLDDDVATTPTTVDAAEEADPRVLAAVLAAMREVLPDRSAAGPDDDFFAAGGHSLLGNRVIVRLRRELGVDLGIADLFDASTPRRLAAVAAGRGAAPVSSPPAPADPDAGPAAATDGVLSPAQRRLWVLESLSDLGATYSVPMVLRLDGDPDPRALVAAIRDVVLRHDALHTVVDDTGPEPYRRVLDSADLAAFLPADPAAALAAVTVETTAAESDDTLRRLASLPFDLVGAPPLHVHLVTVAGRPSHLVLNAHHIAMDEWSAGILLRDLEVAYTARSRARAPQWTTNPTPFSVHAAEAVAAAHSDALEYWRDTLADAPADLAILTRRPRPVTPTGRGATVAVPIPESAADGLRHLGRAGGAGLFAVLKTAVALTLRELGAGVDIPVATPVLGRDDDRFADTIGLFVNTVVLRHRLEDDPTVTTAIERTRTTLAAALAHAAAPFERVVDAVGVDRSLGGNPLAQVLVQLHDGTEAAGTIGDSGPAPFAFRALPPVGDTAKFDLTVEFLAAPGEGPVHATLCYATDLYDAGDADRFVALLAKVLVAMSRHPDTPLSELVPAAPDEVSVLVGPEATGPDTVPEFLATAPAEPPTADTDAAAGPRILADRELGGPELAAEIDALATDLLEAGAGPGRRVAVMAERTVDGIVGLVAAARTGAAVVPLDPAAPTAWHRRVLDETAPTAVLCSPATTSLVEGDAAGRLLVTDHGVRVSCPPRATDRPENAEPTGDDEAYVIYTSGTSGPPKGVLGTQRGLANRLWWECDRDDAVVPRGRVRMLHSALTFIDGITAALGTVGTGGTLVVPAATAVTDVDALAALATRHGVDTITVVPSFLAVVVRERPAFVRSVATWVSSGERLPVPLRAEFRRTAPHTVLIDSYGQTEGSGDDLRIVCCPGDGDPAGAVPDGVGGPVPGVTIHLLDDLGLPVRRGVVGRLHTSGRQLAAGYLGAPDATSRAFVPGPDGVVRYDTGDRAHLDDSGSVVLHPRTDREVKVRGIRVDPAALEWELGATPGVGAVAVIADQGPAGTRLVAFVVPADIDPTASGRTDESSLSDAVLAHARATVPAHLVPARVIIVARLPRTHSGKVDHRALVVPTESSRDAAPRTDTETMLAALYSAVLGGIEVGRTDDFFALGGDSMAVVTLVARAREEGLDLNPQQVFAEPVVERLAALTRPLTAASAPAEPDPLSMSGLEEGQLATLLADLGADR